jgi:hypothetical protein
MTVADMSPGHQYAVRALLKGLEDKFGIHAAGTHETDDSHIGRILKPTHPCQICRGIGAPVAGKSNDLGTEPLRHENPLIDGLVKSHETPFPVIPAKAGIQCIQSLIKPLDPVFQRGDDFSRDHLN